MCIFLHQATEYLLKSIPLVFILYRYKEHELKFLLDMCKKYTLDLVDIFPCRTKQEESVFDLLCRAYVEARYNDNFVVTKEEIDVLILSYQESNYCCRPSKKFAATASLTTTAKLRNNPLHPTRVQ